MIISLGAGIKNPQCERVKVKKLYRFLRDVQQANEAWWSNHIWSGNYRNEKKWECATALVLDIDHHGTAQDFKKRHTKPSKGRRDALEAHGLPIPWHHTPRGARAFIELKEPCDDPKKILTATKAFGRFIQQIVNDAGVAARRDKKGKPTDGYAVDTATFDLARLYYTPNAIVDGEARSARVFKGKIQQFAIDELIALEEAEEADQASDVRVSDEEIADELCKLPCEGENDGSMELIRCARKAIGLGIENAEDFCAVAARWNRDRERPWTSSELTKRFDDVKARWDEGGLAQVPAGNYRRESLHTILETDANYKNKLEWDVIEQTVIYTLDNEKHVVDDVMQTDMEIDICRRYAFKDFPKRHLIDSLASVSHKKQINRITNYLEELEWDGKPRLKRLVRALNLVERHKEIAPIYLRAFLRGAVMRAINPGCKHDCIFVLQGKTGYGKSTFFKTLAGAENFRDTQLDLSNKDCYLQFQRAWIYEWSEVETITHRSDVARVRNFLSSQVDNFRAPYDRIAIDHPRRTVPVGTANSFDILMDQESTRRFWILSISDKIDIEWVQRNRDQLWAETIHELSQSSDHEWRDVPWWLTDEEDKMRERINREFEPDRVTDQLESVMKALDKDKVSATEIYAKLGADPIHMSPSIRSMISSQLRRLGWTRDIKRIKGRTCRLYVREDADGRK